MNRSALVTFSLATAIAVMTLGYATPSYAEKPDCSVNDTHPSCKTDDSEGGATFTVTITGGLGLLRNGAPELQGGSAVDDGIVTPWVQGVVGKNGIGLNDASGDDVGTLTGVGGFFPVDYAPCFDFDNEDLPPPHEISSELHQAYIRPGKKGRAEAHLWFHGETRLPLDETDENKRVRVLYVLKLFGDDGSAAGFPPAENTALTLKMTSWELKVENEGKTIKGMSCLGEGTDLVDIKVTAL